MRNPDFSDKTYTVEVLKTKADGNGPFHTLAKLIASPEMDRESTEINPSPINLCHGFMLSERGYHRLTRVITLADQTQRTIPTTKSVKGREMYLYDVLVAQCRHHIVVAVPFHEMAEDFFPRIDDALGGSGTRYEKLDITQMVIRLGASGIANILTSSNGNTIGLSVTRCHLSYADQEKRTANIQQIRMTGGNLGASKEYRSLISPVLNPERTSLTVTPVILGFALLSDGVRKSSATTDRHGNFKLWISPGLRRLVRIFDLLATLEKMEDVTSVTSNIPIMQSKSIREAED